MNMLFHYHYWTPYVEETERFYVENGFNVKLRVGKYNGEFQEFSPPLKWDDFRHKSVMFRIIEVRKGNVNITFGYGKKVKFDHIGYFVSSKRHDMICENAQKLKWKTEINARRTFIKTPYGFRIELQTHPDLIDSHESIYIKNLKLQTNRVGLNRDLEILFNSTFEHIEIEIGDEVKIVDVEFTGVYVEKQMDPNGVEILGL